ncbi:Peptidoglycan deacetylase [bacterium HR24]|jgi:peptidoglycan/xylan/chitin deacetylase (PgdA/CDA1 family)|nr:Peptidoglycan deacetylase [bacterium HR24]
MWSEGKRVAVTLSFDFDAEALWFETFRMNTPTPLSRGEYGARVGIHRVLSLLDKYGVPATFFIPAWTAEHHTEECKEVARRGHEIAYHSHHHESVVGMRMEIERELMVHSLEVLEKVTGQRPVGNRSVPFDLGRNTPYLLREFGFVYDSSLMGADDPYWLPIDGKDSEIVELPVAWELDDAPFFIFNFFPYMPGLWSPDHVFEIWRQEFDGAYREGGLFLLTMHPEIIGHRARIAMLERLIQYIAQHEGVWWARHIDVALDWKRRQQQAAQAAS